MLAVNHASTQGHSACAKLLGEGKPAQEWGGVLLGGKPLRKCKGLEALSGDAMTRVADLVTLAWTGTVKSNMSNNVSSNNGSASNRGGPRIIAVLENTDTSRWSTYMARRRELTLHLIHPIDSVRTAGAVWDGVLAAKEARKADVNEVFLFAAGAPGAGIDDALPIAAATQHCIPWGFHFAESPCMVDGYAEDSSSYYSALLCRVALGDATAVASHSALDLAKLAKDVDGQSQHSIIWSKEAGTDNGGTRREFIVRNAAQVHLSYVIVYQIVEA
eukprot:NODE_7855_length_1544_cov_5.865208.p1 GENE.NODE_7855_length_1544_cov_5.865208~~NODE_7855_length_1544_cov_5.865208.p1  ORF type:complete len:274 (-),score=66.45 NODE_7855_length_1544_cov_5.865208:236-1057(-)